MRPRLWPGLLALVALAIASCASQPSPPAPTRLIANFEAAADLNPDHNGRPSPLLVRIHELKAPGVFNSADFFSLYKEAGTVLAADRLRSEEMIIKPGERHHLEWTLEPDTRHIGLLAAYRDLDHAIWRALIDIPPHQTTTVTIELGRTAVAVGAPEG